MVAPKINRWQKFSQDLVVCSGLLALFASQTASSTENATIKAPEAAAAKVIGPAVEETKQALAEPRRPGTSTPDEVAARIAIKLAQLRAKENMKKTEPPRQQIKAAMRRPSLPTPATQTISTRERQNDATGNCMFI